MGHSSNFADKLASCVERLAESGVAALGGLFDLSSQRLVRYATTITRDQHEAEDADQAALVQVARNLRTFCRAREPWPYLLRMVRNESLLIGRRKKRWVLSANLSDLTTCRFVDEIELEEAHQAVWAALRTLPGSQAEVVVLKIWEEMTFSQIAGILDLSPDTVASRYRYAMQKLSNKLTPAQGKVSSV